MNSLEELNKYIINLFNKQPDEIKRDAKIYYDRGERARARMLNKMRFGQTIPDDLLEDIKEYHSCYTTMLNLIGADIRICNEIIDNIWR